MRLSHSIPVLKRHARLLSRELEIPLHAALDRLARQQGFRSWSHLSAKALAPTRVGELFADLGSGDLILIAARPRQGKTVLGLELLREAVRAGGSGALFTLESTKPDMLANLGSGAVDEGAIAARVLVDTSDEISADYIIEQLVGSDRGTVVVIDYLQLLDQRRSNPDLSHQVVSLRDFTRKRGLITVCLSQIDRQFELSNRRMPMRSDVRLPNPVDLELFTALWFLHEGRIEIDRLS